MKYRFANKPKNLITELAEHSAMMRVLDSIKRKPGQTILNLPEHQRKILRELKSKDIKEIRWPKNYGK